jgi:hypothetical protein
MLIVIRPYIVRKNFIIYVPRPLYGKMVISCCCYGCTNRQGKNNIRFYRFPRSEIHKNQWIAAMRRDKWAPTKFSRVCSAHFITGAPSVDPLHPDFVPSLFVFSEKLKGPARLNRYLRSLTRKHSMLESEVVEGKAGEIGIEEDVDHTGLEEDDVDHTGLVEDDVDHTGLEEGVYTSKWY